MLCTDGYLQQQAYRHVITKYSKISVKLGIFHSSHYWLFACCNLTVGFEVPPLKMLESSITESSKAYYYAIMKYRAFTENLLKMQESSMTRASLLP